MRKSIRADNVRDGCTKKIQMLHFACFFIRAKHPVIEICASTYQNHCIVIAIADTHASIERHERLHDKINLTMPNNRFSINTMAKVAESVIL